MWLLETQRLLVSISKFEARGRTASHKHSGNWLGMGKWSYQNVSWWKCGSHSIHHQHFLYGLAKVTYIHERIGYLPADMTSHSMEAVAWNVETRTCSLSLPSPKDLGFIYDRSIFFSIIASISSLSALINHSKIPENIDRFMYARFFIVGFDQSVECWSYIVRTLWACTKWFKDHGLHTRPGFTSD
jgi:hypothetical protein